MTAMGSELPASLEEVGVRGERIEARAKTRGGWTMTCLALAALAVPAGASARECCRPFRIADLSWPCPDSRECFVDGRIAVDALGGVYFGVGDGPPVYHFYVSRDSGGAWEEQVFPEILYVPQVVATAAGDVLILYYANMHLWVKTSHDQARTFGDPVMMDVPSTPASYLTNFGIAASPGGRICVYWHWSCSWGGYSDRLWARVSPDAGASWAAPALISRTQGCGMPDVFRTRTVVDDRAAFLAWGEESKVVLASTDASGLRWLPPVQVDDLSSILPDSNRFIEVLALEESRDGALVVAYGSFVPPLATTSVRASLDGGVTWDRTATRYPGPAGHAGIATDGSGRVFVAADLQTQPPSTQALWGTTSSGWGLHGTWEPAGRNIAISPGIDELEVEQDPSDAIWVLNGDYRDLDRSGPCSDCESVRLNRSCDMGASWLVPDIHVDDDAPPHSQHSEDPGLAVSADGRAHVVWTDTAFNGPGTWYVRYASYEAEPVVRPEVLSEPTRCHAGAVVLHAAGGGLEDCASPSFQWFQDGTAVPGATGASHVVPQLPAGRHVFWFETDCAAVRCGSPSAAFTLDVPDEGATSRGEELSGLLFVSRCNDGLRLRWTDSDPAARGYNVYSGRIASLRTPRIWDHVAIACGVPRVPTDAASTERQVPRPTLDAYYLVGGAACDGEGSLGASSLGLVRPVPAMGVPCGAMP